MSSGLALLPGSTSKDLGGGVGMRPLVFLQLLDRASTTYHYKNPMFTLMIEMVIYVSCIFYEVLNTLLKFKLFWSIVGGSSV